MEPINFEILQNITKLHNLLVEHEINLQDNIGLKRDLIKLTESERFNTRLGSENYHELVDSILDLLSGSEFSEHYLTTRISELRKIANVDFQLLDDFCQKALDEIGSDLIKTGPVEHPGEGGEPSNPHHGPDPSKVGSTDLFIENPIKEEDLLGPRLYNVPTDKEPSPLLFTVDGVTYDVREPFTQQLFVLEELGRIDYAKAKEADKFNGQALLVPQPDASDHSGYPTGQALSDFLAKAGPASTGGNSDNSGGTGVEAQELGFEPQKRANTDHPNPWHETIKSEIDPPEFIQGVAEGRSPGLNGEHQKWTDTSGPKTLTVTLQAGVRTNLGARDKVQMHGYVHGEFGPGGLYHKVLDALPQAGSTGGIEPRLHPNLPEQKPTSVWTFDGTFPPKLLMSKYGDPHILRHYNFLPIHPDRNGGFGLHTISTHEHNGPNNGISDGFAQAYFFPGEYYDYYFNMNLAGYTSRNLEASDPKAATPVDSWKVDGEGRPVLDERGQRVPEPNRMIPGEWRETMSTHWFHDHMLDYTSHNVYKGNAAMMNYYSALDRGNEAIDDGVNLRLPSGTAMSWGNRDYDVNLVILDKAWDNEGQLWFNPYNSNGFLGDRMLVNWLYMPYFNVRARRYRFRILNAGVSRFMKLALVRQIQGEGGSLPGPGGSGVSYERVPFWLIANCGNIMMHSIKFDGTRGTTSGTLPVQAIAERFDIIVDFADFNVGDRLYFVNVLEHLNGKRPNKEIALGEILNGSYEAQEPSSHDPCVTKFLEFRVTEYGGTDLSVHPSTYEVGKKMMIPIEPLTESEIRNAVQRNFNFVNKLGTTDEWAIETDGGPDYQADMRRLSANPRTNCLELWTLRNGAPTWAHNVHIHYTEGKILLRDNQLPPIWEQFARKDVYRVGGKVDSSESVVIALKFGDVIGDSYMQHCHNVAHEDVAMLLRFDVSGENCVHRLPCPLPTWQGVKFLETKTLPTYRTGMLEDNLFFVKPEAILRKLREIDHVVPDEETGSYFVNGLGKSLQTSED